MWNPENPAATAWWLYCPATPEAFIKQLITLILLFALFLTAHDNTNRAGRGYKEGKTACGYRHIEISGTVFPWRNFPAFKSSIPLQITLSADPIKWFILH